MKIVITNDTDQFYRECADKIANVIREKPNAKIGLSTGRTTKGVHKALAEIQKAEGFDCSKLTVFGIDEVTNMPRSCKASCWYILLHEVIWPLGIPEEQFIMPDGNAPDLEAEIRRFEAEVEKDGGPDYIFLGLGENGHLAFNQPGTPFGSTAGLNWMDSSLEERLRRENPDLSEDAKLGGMTLGIRTIMRCQRLTMGANGSNKAKVVWEMLTGPVTEALPASILNLHPNIDLILDPAAAESYKKTCNRHQD